jgi:hypothetical protein
MSDAENEPIQVPPICQKHFRDMIVEKLKIPPSGPWQVAAVTANLLLFQAATADDRIWKQAEGKQENLSDILGRIGCLACWSEDSYDRMILVQKKGLSHAAQVAQGKAIDPDWKLDLRKPS